MSSLEDTERGSRCVFASSYPARPPGCLQGHRKGCEREAPNRGVAGRVVTRRKRRPAPQGGGRWEGSPAQPRGISRRPVGFPGAALSPAGPSSPPPCPGRASGAVGEGVPGAPRTGSSCLSCLPRSARLSGGHCGRQTQPHVHRLEADARPPDSSGGLGLRDLGADVRGGHTPRLPAPMAMRAWNAPVPAAKGRPVAPDAHSRQGRAWDRAWGADGGAASSAPLRRALLLNVQHDKDARKPCLLWAPKRALRSSASSPASVNRALQVGVCVQTAVQPGPPGRFSPDAAGAAVLTLRDPVFFFFL